VKGAAEGDIRIEPAAAPPAADRPRGPRPGPGGPPRSAGPHPGARPGPRPGPGGPPRRGPPPKGGKPPFPRKPRPN
jgi:hypothetical protein